MDPFSRIIKQAKEKKSLQGIEPPRGIFRIGCAQESVRSFQNIHPATENLELSNEEVEELLED